MLLLDLVCSCSLLTAAILDSSVPLTKIIDLPAYRYSSVHSSQHEAGYEGRSQEIVVGISAPPTCTDYPHQDLGHTLA